MDNRQKNPLFSIVSVTLNNLQGLNRTFNSVKCQSFQGFEWIVIDGASNDGTESFLKEHGDCWISEPDRGLYDAMNKGIDHARGDYILFLNAGDALTGPDTLQKIYEAVKQSKPDFVYGDSYEELAGQHNYKPARSHLSAHRGMFTHHQAMLYRRIRIGGLRYNLNYKIAADYDFTCRFLKKTNAILYLPFPLCVFESGGVSQKKAVLGRREQFKIRLKNRTGSLPANILVYAAQSALWTLRGFMPGLYWRLKSGGNKNSGLPQT
ncbi:MAG: glycosyltransferase [Alphaproteobacteria bacterium]|nr:glycosyltransferase [Alphaproteobacteria bacterium]